MILSFKIRYTWDPYSVVHQIKKECKLESSVRERTLLIVKELSTNIVKYAGEGDISISLIGDEVEILAQDRGPGIEELEKSIKDGFARGSYIVSDEKVIRHQGLGSGLPSVFRLADEVDIQSNEDGTMIKAKIVLN